MKVEMGAYRLQRVNEGFELLRVSYPGFKAIVDFNNPVPLMRNLKLLDRNCKASELAKAKREAEQYLVFVSKLNE